MPYPSQATRDNIVNRALAYTTWFEPKVLYAIASPNVVSMVLNDLEKAGDLERRYSKTHALQFRWVNSRG